MSNKQDIKKDALRTWNSRALVITMLVIAWLSVSLCISGIYMRAISLAVSLLWMVCALSAYFVCETTHWISLSRCVRLQNESHMYMIQTAIPCSNFVRLEYNRSFHFIFIFVFTLCARSMFQASIQWICLLRLVFRKHLKWYRIEPNHTKPNHCTDLGLSLVFFLLLPLLSSLLLLLFCLPIVLTTSIFIEFAHPKLVYLLAFDQFGWSDPTVSGYHRAHLNISAIDYRISTEQYARNLTHHETLLSLSTSLLLSCIGRWIGRKRDYSWSLFGLSPIVSNLSVSFTSFDWIDVRKIWFSHKFFTLFFFWDDEQK